MLKKTLTCGALLLLGACASSGTLITSFDSMTSDTVTDKGSYIDQNRVFSLSGSLPQASPGQFMRYSGKRGVSTGYGISTIGESYIQVKELPAPANRTAKITAVRNEILAVRLQSLKAVRLRLDVAKERARQATLKEPEETNPLVQLVKDLDTAEGDLDKAVKKAGSVIDVSSLLVVRWTTKDESNGRLAALVSAARNKTVETSGYMILAGVRESTLFVSPDICDVMPVKDVMRLDWGWHPVWNFIPWFWEMQHERYTRLTTRTLMTNEIAYLQDSETSSALMAKIEASYKDLKDLKGALEELDKIEIEVSLAKASSLSNQGRLADAEWTLLRTPFRNPPGGVGGNPSTGRGNVSHVGVETYLNYGGKTGSETVGKLHMCDDACRHERLDLDGWQTVFAVDANYFELCEMFE